MRSGSKWPMISPWPCAYACAYVDPVFTRQSHDISVTTSTRRTNLSVFLVLMLMLMLMSTQFSLAIHMCLCLCLGLCASENQGLMQTAVFAFSDFTIPVCPYLRLRFAGGSTRLPRLFSFIHSLLF